MEAIVAASSLLIGREVASRTISGTSSSIITRLGHINDDYGEDCKKLFAELDIEFKMDIISSYVDRIQGDFICESVSKCVNYIKETLLEIEDEMKKLQEIKNEYTKQWFGNALSSTKFTNSFNLIKQKVSILDNRFTMLMKLFR